MGMTWARLGDEGNGMAGVLAIFVLEAPFFLLLAWWALEAHANSGLQRARLRLCFARPVWLRCMESARFKSSHGMPAAANMAEGCT